MAHRFQLVLGCRRRAKPHKRFLRKPTVKSLIPQTAPIPTKAVLHCGHGCIQCPTARSVGIRLHEFVFAGEAEVGQRLASAVAVGSSMMGDQEKKSELELSRRFLVPSVRVVLASHRHRIRVARDAGPGDGHFGPDAGGHSSWPRSPDTSCLRR